MEKEPLGYYLVSALKPCYPVDMNGDLDSLLLGFARPSHS
jgi:hypothetical protein